MATTLPESLDRGRVTARPDGTRRRRWSQQAARSCRISHQAEQAARRARTALAGAS